MNGFPPTAAEQNDAERSREERILEQGEAIVSGDERQAHSDEEADEHEDGESTASDRDPRTEAALLVALADGLRSDFHLGVHTVPQTVALMESHLGRLFTAEG